MIVEEDRASHRTRARGAGPRLLVVGVSTTPVCGVRDYSRVVGNALQDAGMDVEVVWWERDPRWSVTRTLSEQQAWLEQVEVRARSEQPDWIVWHYSVFAWAVAGVPLLAPGAARRLGRLGLPILLVAHELTFPFGRRGWKGLLWATTQRLALVWPLHASRFVVVTTEERRRWLESRRWLPSRPVRCLPVCSNLPAVAGPPSTGPVAGVVGFGTEGALAGETMQALARLRADGIDVRALLVGAPGEVGTAPDRWRAAAREARMTDALEFTGVLPAPELAAALAGTEVVILPDPGGPSSRRGVVAAALALAKPTVAVDGPETWQALVESGALSLASPSAEGLAEVLTTLLRDDERRRAMGARAAEFYERRMAPRVLATALRTLLEGELRAGEEAISRPKVVVAP